MRHGGAGSQHPLSRREQARRRHGARAVPCSVQFPKDETRGTMTEQTSLPPEPTLEAQEELERRGRLLQIMTISGIVVCAVFLLLMLLPFIGGWWPYFVIFSVLLCCCAVSAFLNRQGHLRPAGYLFLFALSLSILGVVLGGTLHLPCPRLCDLLFPPDGAGSGHGPRFQGHLWIRHGERGADRARQPGGLLRRFASMPAPTEPRCCLSPFRP